MNPAVDPLDKYWTIALASAASGFPNGKSGAVVIIGDGGGSVRLKAPTWIRWDNPGEVAMRLKFEDWPGEGGEPAEPVWPFNQNSGASSLNIQEGSVTIAPGGYFRGRVAGTGRIVIKYSVAALDAEGNPDDAVIALDPMVIVER